MTGIIVEGVLFVALVAAAIALLFVGLMRWTPLGLRWRQAQNRRALERADELMCAVHGVQREEDMVRLPSGGRICPACYKEALDD